MADIILTGKIQDQDRYGKVSPALVGISAFKKEYGGALKRLSLPKHRRLVKERQFKSVLACNLRADDDLLTLFVAENNCGYPRLGVSVGKQCGGAVVRNRLKRLLREVFRQSQNDIPAGFDYVLMISPRWSRRPNETGGKDGTKRPPAFKQVRDSFLKLVETALEKKEMGYDKLR